MIEWRHQGGPGFGRDAAPMAARSSRKRSYSTIFAPCARVASSFERGASTGITSVAGIPMNRAAIATAWAWLPEENATTPRGRSVFGNREYEVRRAADLERAPGLEVFALEER